MRLVDGDKPHIGRLEIFVHNRWGTVCRNHFGSSEALVACSQLGYTGYSSYSSQFGLSSDPIWMGDVHCPDTEMEREQPKIFTRLADCFKKGTKIPFSAGTFWGQQNCTHTEDVGLICESSSMCAQQIINRLLNFYYF